MNNKIIYRRSQPVLHEAIVDAMSGSQFWSIEGENVQLTWFDVPANSNFKPHKHSSEQITYVLEGELFFKSQNTIHKLSKGDCILIPGNTEHEVWTEKLPAKAIDAWSPINKKYLVKTKL